MDILRSAKKQQYLVGFTITPINTADTLPKNSSGSFVCSLKTTKMRLKRNLSIFST